MNDQITILLQKLSEKLGTTSEYLWGVLIKQAYIDATISTVIFLIACLGCFLIFKLHKKFSREEKYDEDFLPPAMVIGSFIWGLITIITFCTFVSDLSGFFNPEYKALRQILSSLK